MPALRPLAHRPFRQSLLSAALASAALGAPLAHATTVADPAGDFIPTFAGAPSPDLDVLSVSATIDSTTLHLAATLNGAIGTLPSALYVFGVNRGAANNNFAAIGLPGVVFDAVITMTGTGVLGGRDLVANAALTLPAGARSISGNGFTIDVPLALLPSQGLATTQYQINLWPRDASVAAGNTQIADFAPNATVFTVSQVPEPSSYAMVLAGSLALLAFARRRRS